MGDKSKIQWTDATWNTVYGCSRVSEGCVNCYAERLFATRLREMYPGIAEMKNGKPSWTRKIQPLPDRLDQPLRWKKPRMIFVNSVSDTFHPDVPFEFIDRLFAVMALCPQHTFQVLTKRPERMREYFAAGINLQRRMVEQARELRGGWCCYEWPLPNVWLGTSCENQAAADKRIPELMACPAAVRFVSAEPLLERIDFSTANGDEYGEDDIGLWETEGCPDWFIIGGESGPGARPCHIDWIRGIIAQCQEAGVACFVKQLGSCVSGQVEHPDNEGYGVNEVRLKHHKGGDPDEWPEDLKVREWPEAVSAL